VQGRITRGKDAGRSLFLRASARGDRVFDRSSVP
jgi:hypothetical protein